MPNMLRYAQREILLVFIFLIVSVNGFSEVMFLNVGGPREIKCYEISSFQHNTSGIKTVNLQLTHDIDGKFYSYWITPISEKKRSINGAFVQIWCEPIDLAFSQRDAVISDDKKSIRFIFGISDELKEKMRIKVTISFNDNSEFVLNFDKEAEQFPVKEYVECGGLQVK